MKTDVKLDVCVLEKFTVFACCFRIFGHIIQYVYYMLGIGKAIKKIWRPKFFFSF